MNTSPASSPPPAAGPPGQEAAGVQDPLDESLLDELSPVEFEALRWSVRVSDGLDGAARAGFQAWLAADPAHRVAYEDVAGVWEALDELPPEDGARLRATVAIEAAAGGPAVPARPGTAPTPTPTPTPMAARDGAPADEAAPVRAAARPTPPRRRAPQALAAVLALGLLGGGSWFGWQHWQRQPVFSHHYATERGQSLDVALPDGSGLLLDTASEADVTLYRHRREVRLPEGQAVFRVQADAARPFDVLAGATRITVVGTAFSVRYTPSLGDRAVQVAVIEGRVRVASRAAGAEAAPAAVVELVPGQAVAADAEGRLGGVTQVVAEAIAPWRSRRLSFDGVPLARVLAEIGRYGDTGVRVPDPAVGRLPVTASVSLQNLDAFVRTLPQVLPVRLERREDGVEIVAGPR